MGPIIFLALGFLFGAFVAAHKRGCCIWMLVILAAMFLIGYFGHP